MVVFHVDNVIMDKKRPIPWNFSVGKLNESIMRIFAETCKAIPFFAMLNNQKNFHISLQF